MLAGSFRNDRTQNNRFLLGSPKLVTKLAMSVRAALPEAGFSL